MAVFLDLTAAIPPDADPIVLSALASRLIALDVSSDGLPMQEAFRAYARGVLKPVFARLGWDKKPGESDNTALVRSSMLGALSRFGDAEVLAEARARFDRYLTDPSSLNAASRRTVLQIVAVHADQQTWDQLHALAKAAKTQLETQEFYSLLGAALDDGLAKQALALAFSGEPPFTVSPDIIGAVSQNHPEMAFDYMAVRWKLVSARLEPTARAAAMPRMVMNASDPKLIAKLDAFADKNIPVGAPPGRAQGGRLDPLPRENPDRAPA